MSYGSPQDGVVGAISSISVLALLIFALFSQAELVLRAPEISARLLAHFSAGHWPP